MFNNDVRNLNDLYAHKIIKEDVGLGPNAISDVGLGSIKPTIIDIPKKKCACGEEEECSCEHCHYAEKGCKCNGCEECKANQSPSEDCENCEMHGGSEESGARMVKQELFRIHKISAMLHDLLSDEENVEPWVLSKISTSLENLDSIFGFKDYEKYRQKFQTDMSNVEENNEESLYTAIDRGGEQLVNKLKSNLKRESIENLEKILFETIKVIENKKIKN
jgi:hypothetical protein